MATVLPAKPGVVPQDFVRSACCCLSSRVHGTNVLESDKNSPAAIPHDTKCHLQYPWIMGTAEFSGCHIDGKYVITFGCWAWPALDGSH